MPQPCPLRSPLPQGVALQPPCRTLQVEVPYSRKFAAACRVACRAWSHDGLAGHGSQYSCTVTATARLLQSLPCLPGLQGVRGTRKYPTHPLLLSTSRLIRAAAGIVRWLQSWPYDSILHVLACPRMTEEGRIKVMHTCEREVERQGVRCDAVSVNVYHGW